jgi:hypothetical protein
MYGFSVSLGQSFRVMAKGVRLNGDPGGFSEFRQRRMYSGDEEDGEVRWGSEMSGWRVPLPIPTCLAMSCEFQRPAISYATSPLESTTWPASLPHHPRGLKVKMHWSPVRWFVI